MKLIYTEYITIENIVMQKPSRIVTNRIKVLKFKEADQQKNGIFSPIAKLKISRFC